MKEYLRLKTTDTLNKIIRQIGVNIYQKSRRNMDF